MGIRDIRIYGDSVLKQQCKDVDKIDERICQLLDDMLETMYNKNGVGLAAPQVGILRNIVVIDIGDGPIELINPKIVKSHGRQVAEEGCLSLPNQYFEVERPKVVEVCAINRKGEQFILRGKKFFARALCHEIDHLHGILIIDKSINPA